MSLVYAAEIIERTSQGIGLSVVRASCDGCMTGCANTAKIHLPTDMFDLSSNNALGAEVEVRITGSNQRHLLIHSLILPLIGFIVGSLLASCFSTIFYESSDAVVLLGALVGFLIGIRVCKRSGFEVLVAENLPE